jgi:hypothetical protein
LPLAFHLSHTKKRVLMTLHRERKSIACHFSAHDFLFTPSSICCDGCNVRWRVSRLFLLLFSTWFSIKSVIQELNAYSCVLSGIDLHDKVLIPKCLLSLPKIKFSVFYARLFVKQDRVLLYSIWLVTISSLFKVKFSKRRPGIWKPG